MSSHKQPKDLNNDGKIDEREVATSKLAEHVMKARKEDLGNVNRAHLSKHYLDMFEHDADEVIITTVKKHPIGLIAIWIVTIFIFLAFWAAIGWAIWYRDDIVTANSTINLTTNDVSMFGIVIGGALSILTLIFGYIAAFLYINNFLVITSEKIVLIKYISLFNRKVSSLSIGDVQDVSAHQDGLIAMIFGYGTIIIETSGEQNNYNFTMARDPNVNAKTITQSHEDNLHLYGN